MPSRSLSVESGPRLKSYRQVARDFDGNPGQRDAYDSRGHCVILAGPGSGKTKTLTVKLARLAAEDVRPPRGIACLTYSLECAAELRRRLAELGLEGSRNLYVGTVHAFCFKHVLLPYGRLSDPPVAAEVSVASKETADTMFAEAVKHVISVDVRPESYRTRCVAHRRNFPDQAGAGFRENDEQMAALVLDFERRLRAAKLVDFEMMVLDGLRLIERHKWVREALLARFPILAVDEYQDLGLPLHRIVLSLCFGAGVRLLAVGDPDQSIYGFTGAKPELLRELSEREDVQRIQLRFNYRSGQNIVGMSQVVLGEPRGYRSKSQHEDTIDFYHCPDGIESQADMICETIIPSALRRRPGLTPGQIAVLYLDRHDGEVIATRLGAAGMAFVRADAGAPYPRTPLTRWLEGGATWCAGGWRNGEPRLALLLGEWLEFHRPLLLSERAERFCRTQLMEFMLSHRDPELLLCRWLKELLADTMLGQALGHPRALADEREDFEVLRAACEADSPLYNTTLARFAYHEGLTDRLKLVTLHSAKGLEFDVVIMMGMDQGRIPNYRLTTEASKREPRRLFYVGLTRARHEVHMTYSGGYTGWGGRKYYYGASEFLLEVQRKMQRSA